MREEEGAKRIKVAAMMSHARVMTNRVATCHMVSHARHVQSNLILSRACLFSQKIVKALAGQLLKTLPCKPQGTPITISVKHPVSCLATTCQRLGSERCPLFNIGLPPSSHGASLCQREGRCPSPQTVIIQRNGLRGDSDSQRSLDS